MLAIRTFFLSFTSCANKRENRSATHVKWLQKVEIRLQIECLWHAKKERKSRACLEVVKDFSAQISCHKSRQICTSKSNNLYVNSWRQSRNYEPLARMAQSAINELKRSAEFRNTRISFFLCWVLFSFLAKRKKNLTGIVSVASAPQIFYIFAQKEMGRKREYCTMGNNLRDAEQCRFTRLVYSAVHFAFSA